VLHPSCPSSPDHTSHADEHSAVNVSPLFRSCSAVTADRSSRQRSPFSAGSVARHDGKPLPGKLQFATASTACPCRQQLRHTGCPSMRSGNNPNEFVREGLAGSRARRRPTTGGKCRRWFATCLEVGFGVNVSPAKGLPGLAVQLSVGLVNLLLCSSRWEAQAVVKSMV
jgi:hypothetical protein